MWVIPSAYSLRHARGYGRSALRNWQFQVSKDGVTWTTLYDHQEDQSLSDPGSTATWQLSPASDEKQGNLINLLKRTYVKNFPRDHNFAT